MGNTQTCTTWKIDSLAQGTYYWSVQAIDHGFKGGNFSAEGSFTINLLSADFTAPETCQGSNTVFTDKSNNTGTPVISWSWYFGDGQNSSLQNPEHLYAAAGNYQVKLVVRSGESCDSIVKTVVIKEKPLAGFTANTVCLGISTIFTNTTNANGLPVTGWLWNFGNGASSSLQNPGTHTYQNPGNYNVSLEATASNGCSSVTEKIVTVGEYPVSTVSADGPLTFCQGDSVILSVNQVSSYLYQWKNYGGNITSATASSYKAKTSGVYFVEIINPVGNCKSASNNLNVSVQSSPASPLISNSGSTSFCQGDSVTLSVPDSPGNIYQWKLNGGNTGTNSWKISAKASGTYTLAITNSGGCSVTSANSVNVNAFPNPVVANLNISGPVSFCEGQNVHLSVTYNSSYVYQWYNNSAPVTGANSNSFLANATGNYRLSVKNTDGCERLSEFVNVTVSPFPVKPLIISENYIQGQCQGETPIILKVDQANPQYTFQWEEDGKVISGATQNQYSGILKSALYSVNVNNSGCTAKSEIKIEVENVRKPSIVAQGPNVWYLACTIDSAAIYKWYLNNKLINGAESYLYVANQQMGTYMVTIGTRKGCFATSDPLTIPFGATTGIEENITSGIRIFPNPTPGMLKIEMNNQLYGDLINGIYSEDGSGVMNTVMNKPTQDFSSQLDLGSLRNGTYIIRMMISNYQITKKIIINR